MDCAGEGKGNDKPRDDPDRRVVCLVKDGLRFLATQPTSSPGQFGREAEPSSDIVMPKITFPMLFFLILSCLLVVKRSQQFPKREEKGIKCRQYADVLGLLTDQNARSILV